MSASRKPLSVIPSGSQTRCLQSSLKSMPLAASATKPARAPREVRVPVATPGSSVVEVLATPVPASPVNEVRAAEVAERDRRVAVKVQRGLGPRASPYLPAIADRRCVRQELPHRDGQVRCVRDVDLEREVRVDVLVQVQQSVLNERHDPRARDGLGHRCELEHVSLGVRIPRSRSAQPTPVENTTSSPQTTATLIPGVIASASFLRRYCRSSSVPGRVMVLTNENGAIAPTPATRVARAMNSRRDSGEPDGASDARCEMTGDGSGRTGSRGTARRARARSRVILLDPLPIPSVGSNLGNSRTWTRLTARPPGGTVVTGSPARQTVAPGCEEGPWI
jgi:hypothetical protein